MKHTMIIIGAGLAGLSAALTAADYGWTVKLVSAQASERAQSVMAEGGINAALNTKGEGDSPEEHYADTLRAGCDLADPGAVWNMVHAAPGLVRMLQRIGVQFNLSGPDELDLRNFGGQKKKRTAFAQSDTGKQIMTAMIDAVRREEVRGTVERYPHHEFVTLLAREGVCRGAVVRDRFTGAPEPVPADAVLFATGGLHGLFGNTTGSLMDTGAAAAELFRLGVPMANLEMIQYHPTTVSAGGKRMLISEAARAEGGRLYALRDGAPWYFMEEKYPELGNLMPRDVTSREIWQVSRTMPVYLDMTSIPAAVVDKKLSGLLSDCLLYLGKDIRKEPVPVYPGIHYFMGGIQVDRQHRAGMPGLYAAGECCAQYHGANRLGGNSLLGALYGGQIAARTACEEGEREDAAGAAGEPVIAASWHIPDAEPGNVPALQHILLDALGVVRDGDTLQAAARQVSEMPGSLALLGRAALESALARRESRGAHWRSDFPARDDDRFRKTTVARYDGKEIQISFQEIPERRLEE